jgi:hypothetical protein
VQPSFVRQPWQRHRRRRSSNVGVRKSWIAAGAARSGVKVVQCAQDAFAPEQRAYLEPEHRSGPACGSAGSGPACGPTGACDRCGAGGERERRHQNELAALTGDSKVESEEERKERKVREFMEKFNTAQRIWEELKNGRKISDIKENMPRATTTADKEQNAMNEPKTEEKKNLWEGLKIGEKKEVVTNPVQQNAAAILDVMRWRQGTETELRESNAQRERKENIERQRRGKSWWERVKEAIKKKTERNHPARMREYSRHGESTDPETDQLPEEHSVTQRLAELQSQASHLTRNERSQRYWAQQQLVLDAIQPPNQPPKTAADAQKRMQSKNAQGIRRPPATEYPEMSPYADVPAPLNIDTNRRVPREAAPRFDHHGMPLQSSFRVDTSFLPAESGIRSSRSCGNMKINSSRALPPLDTMPGQLQSRLVLHNQTETNLNQLRRPDATAGQLQNRLALHNKTETDLHQFRRPTTNISPVSTTPLQTVEPRIGASWERAAPLTPVMQVVPSHIRDDHESRPQVDGPRTASGSGSGTGTATNHSSQVQANTPLAPNQNSTIINQKQASRPSFKVRPLLPQESHETGESSEPIAKATGWRKVMQVRSVPNLHMEPLSEPEQKLKAPLEKHREKRRVQLKQSISRPVPGVRKPEEHKPTTNTATPPVAQTSYIASREVSQASEHQQPAGPPPARRINLPRDRGTTFGSLMRAADLSRSFEHLAERFTLDKPKRKSQLSFQCAGFDATWLAERSPRENAIREAQRLAQQQQPQPQEQQHQQQRNADNGADANHDGALHPRRSRAAGVSGSKLRSYRSQPNISTSAGTRRNLEHHNVNQYCGGDGYGYGNGRSNEMGLSAHSGTQRQAPHADPAGSSARVRAVDHQAHPVAESSNSNSSGTYVSPRAYWNRRNDAVAANSHNDSEGRVEIARFDADRIENAQHQMRKLPEWI